MPLYEYYCDTCVNVFEAIRPFSASDQPTKCPTCDRDSDRIMPTTFATMSRRQGLRERVPFHHHDIRNVDNKKTIARVKPRSTPARTTTKTTKPKKD